MSRYVKPYEPTFEASKLDAIYTALRLGEATFSKNQASRLVGGRYELERLVASRRIRMVKPGERQNSPWKCNAEDVLRCVPIA